MDGIGRKLLIAIGSCVLAGGAAASAQQPPQPKIKLSQTMWDIGQVWHKEKPKLDLIVSNEGNSELRIERVHTSCGCTAAQPEKTVLAPGESTPVHVVFDSNGKQGNVTSKVIVFSNDPRRHEASMDIKVFVKRAVTMEPIGGLFVRSLKTDEKLACKVKIQNHEAEPMKLEIKQSKTPGWDIQINEVTPGVLYEVTATTKGPVPPGTTRGHVLFSTGLKREPTLNVPVRSIILSRVELVPRAFAFLKEDTEPATRRISVEYYGDEDFKLTSVAVSDPIVEATIEPSRVNKGEKSRRSSPTPKIVVPVRLEVPPGRQLPKEPIKVQMTTNDPEYPLLEVVITTDPDLYQTLQHADTPMPKQTAGGLGSGALLQP